MPRTPVGATHRRGPRTAGGKSGRKGGFALLRTCVNQKCYLSFHAFFCKEHGTRTFSLAPELFPVHCFCGSCLFFCLPLSVTICVLQNNDDIFIASQCLCNVVDYHSGTDKKMRDKNRDPSFCRTSFCQNDANRNRCRQSHDRKTEAEK